MHLSSVVADIPSSQSTVRASSIPSMAHDSRSPRAIHSDSANGGPTGMGSTGLGLDLPGPSSVRLEAIPVDIVEESPSEEIQTEVDQDVGQVDPSNIPAGTLVWAKMGSSDLLCPCYTVERLHGHCDALGRCLPLLSGVHRRSR